MDFQRKPPSRPDLAPYTGHRAKIVDPLTVPGSYKILAVIGPGSMSKRELLAAVASELVARRYRPVAIIPSWTTRPEQRDVLDRAFYRQVSARTFNESMERGTLTPSADADGFQFACERSDVVETLERRHGFVMLDEAGATEWARMLPAGRLCIIRLKRLPASPNSPTAPRLKANLDIALDPNNRASFDAAVEAIITYVTSLRA